MLYNLLAAVMMLLLIACSNVANLLLARATVREKEIAVRAALGATRGRLIRQLLVESFVLAAAACVTGCFFAYFGLKGVTAMMPQKGIGIGGEAVIGLDRSVFLFALGTAGLTTLICGLAPALRAAGRDLQTPLGGSSKGSNGNFRHGKLRAGLVIGEVALSIVLLMGAGLMMRSFFRLTHVGLGFDPHNLVLMALGPPPGRYQTTEQNRVFTDQVLQRLKALPGVSDVAANYSLLGYNGGFESEVDVPATKHSARAKFEGCSESLLRTLGLRLIRGRWLSEDDVSAARHVAVLNQTMARSFFGDADPVGQQIKLKSFDSQSTQDADFEIVGVASDIKNNGGPEQPVMAGAYIPYTIEGEAPVILVRTKVAPSALMRAMQEQVWAVDPDVVFGDFESIETTLQQLTYSAPEFGLTTLASLAGIALLLVVTGVFSVMAYTVSLQTQEIGVRMALGAQPNDILRMVLKKGLGLIAGGIFIGVLASLWLTHFLASQIWGVSTTDPFTFTVVVGALAVVGSIACLLPARRATRVDPMVALHYE